MAAAPGETLPNFPEPTHTFPVRSFLDVVVDEKKVSNNIVRYVLHYGTIVMLWLCPAS